MNNVNKEIIDAVTCLHMIQARKSKIKRHEFVCRWSKRLFNVDIPTTVRLSDSLHMNFDVSLGLCGNISHISMINGSSAVNNRLADANESFSKARFAVMYPVGGHDEYVKNRRSMKFYTNKNRWKLLDFWILSLNNMLQENNK